MKEYRMKRAAILLRQTQATIAEISNQVGYENQSKFATAFRDVMKITPAEYRKQDEAHLGEDFSIEGISIQDKVQREIPYMIDLECKKKEGFCGKSFNSGF